MPAPQFLQKFAQMAGGQPGQGFGWSPQAPGQGPATPGILNGPTALDQTMPGQQPGGGMFGGAPGGGMAGLLQNPMFMAGMGMLSGNQQGDPFAGAMQGLQGAQTAGLEEAERQRTEDLRKVLMEYFRNGGGAGGGAPEITPGGEFMLGGGLPFGGDQTQSRLDQLDPALRLMMGNGTDTGNGYGGVNPFMLGQRVG